MMRINTKSLMAAVVLFSIAALPNPSTTASQSIATAYFAFINIAFFFTFISHRFRVDRTSLIYFGCVIVFLYANYISYASNSSEIQTWIKRSIALIYTPIIIMAMLSVQKRHPDFPQRVVDYILLVASFEGLSIVLLATLFPDDRATNFEGLLVYSAFLVAGAYFSAQRFKTSRSLGDAVFYLFLVGAAGMTGSRGLTLSTLLPILLFIRLNVKSILLIGITCLGGIVFSSNIPVIGRTFQGSPEDLLTISAKASEIELLFQMFLSSPIIGVGFGLPFQTPFDLAAFTYSHNWFFFALGYGGLVGLLLHFAPLIFFALKKSRENGWILVCSLLVFYASSTTYTNFKHSIVLACIYVSCVAVARGENLYPHTLRKTKI